MKPPKDSASQSPNELARELGISPKTLRQWLREEYPRPYGQKGTRWEIKERQCAAARNHWTH
jgi:predicted site-specific integrase-resolvase